MEKISVAVRVRPSVSNSETINGFKWRVESNRISLQRSEGTAVPGLSFAFDHVLDEECSNSVVYELGAKHIIEAAVDGFNGTVFAYGQTSSGKTFTMNGCASDPGIIPRAVKDIFAKVEKMVDREFLIRVSYMEIYNEEINDLFTEENQKLQIHESLARGVFVAGLREEIVNSPDQVLNLIKLGEANRHFGETNMNARSSRSHTIFRMVVESKSKDDSSCESSSSDDLVRISVLNLVDLAGSERIAKTGAGGVRLKEGKHINKSLMMLGNVINKLSEGVKQRCHIPYRDSKLTRILQPALGGNAKTSIICTVATEEIHTEETKGTLQFASRAKKITNCVQVNEILTDAALLKRQKLEIEELRSKLQGSHAEILEQEILKLRNEMLKYELEREKLSAELEEERRSHKERELQREQQMKIGNLSNFATSNADGSSSRVAGKVCLMNSMQRNDGFTTPFNGIPNAFVARRSTHSMQVESSSSPGTFGDVADEDTWAKMNMGYKCDLDSLDVSSAGKVQPFSVNEDCSTENNAQEMENMRSKIKFLLYERDQFKRKYDEQVAVNDHLAREISELQHEVLLIRELPRTISDMMANSTSICKDIVYDLQGKLGGQFSSWKQETENEIAKTRQRIKEIEAEFKERLYVSESKFNSLEMKYRILIEDKETTLKNVSSATEMLGQVIDQKDSALRDLENERRTRKSLKKKSVTSRFSFFVI